MAGLSLLSASTAWACGNESECDGPQGEPADVETAPGTYDGFELLECPERPSPDFEVRGTGRMWFMGVEPGAADRSESLAAFSSDVIEPAIAHIDVVQFLGGAGTTCAGIGPAILLKDWNDVDAVVSAVGGALRDEDLRESVGISVTGDVCAE